MRVKQISVLLTNKPGMLSTILEEFSKNDINILGLTINETANFGELRLVVNNLAGAKATLRDLAVSYNIVDVIIAVLEDKPGALLNIAKLLSDNYINMDYIYTLSSGRERALVVIKTWNMDETEEILENKNIKMFSMEQN